MVVSCASDRMPSPGRSYFLIEVDPTWSCEPCRSWGFLGVARLEIWTSADRDIDHGELTRLVTCSDLHRYFTESVLDEFCVTLQNPLTLRIAKLLHEVQLLREEELYKKRSELVSTIKSELSCFGRNRLRYLSYRRTYVHCLNFLIP